jgi:hypothetical protein
LINKPSAEEKKLLVRAFNFIFHEFKFSAQTSKIFLQHILVLIFIRLISIILYYLNCIIVFFLSYFLILHLFSNVLSWLKKPWSTFRRGSF